MEIELKRKKAVQILMEFATEGHKPLKVITEDFEVYVAKSGKSQTPPISISNELLCSFFLKAWGISTPEIALIDIDPTTIDIDLATTNPRHYYKAVCFGSKYLSNSVEVNRLLQPESITDLRKLKYPEDFLWIALFDMWVENEDRKPSNPNLLLSAEGTKRQHKIFAIDHAYTFLTLRYEELKPEWGLSQAVNDSILDSATGRSIVELVSEKKIESFRKLYLEKVRKCKERYIKIVSTFPSEIGFTGCQAIFLGNFLFDPERISKVFANFVARL